MLSISIVIATYNAALTLQSCLDSIIPQLTDQVELLIIDGNSTDNTPQIILNNKENIKFWLSEPDRGIYDAWNKGILHADGKWIMFIGADDRLMPNAISTFLQLLTEHPNIENYDYICARNQYVDYNGNFITYIGKPVKWNENRRRMVAAHVGSLHNKGNLFDKLGLYDLNYRICADYELLLRKKDSLKSLFIPKTIAVMAIGGMSFSVDAVYETYKIRKRHKTVPSYLNCLLFFYDLMLYKSFSIRKSIFKKNRT